MQWTFYHVPLLLGVISSFVLGAFVFRYRDTRGGLPLLGFLLCAGLYCLIYAIQLAHISVAASLTWSRLTFPAFSFAALFFLLFSLEYTNREDWTTMSRGLLLAVPPAFASVAPFLWADRVYQNPRMGEQFSVTLLRFEFGDVYLLVLGIVFTYLFVALALSLIQFVRSGRAGVFQRQQLAIVGLSIPALAGLLQALTPIQLALAPISFVVAGLHLTVAILRYDFFEVLPVARRRVFQHVNAGVLVVGPDGRIVDANPQAERLFSDRNLVNSDFNNLKLSTNTTDLHDSDELGSYERTRSDGKRRIYDIEHTPISDDYDQFNGWIVLFYDVTDREQQKQQLEEAKRTLEQSNEKLDQFAGMVSHDLRNPLHVIAGHVELLRPEAPEEHVEAIENSAERMETIIDDLLTLSRVGESIGDPGPVSLATVVADSWATVSSDGVELDVDIPDDVEVEADGDRLQHVFDNLFRNASEHNEPPVTIRVGTLSDETGTVSGFFVADDGAGIPESDRKKVFEYGYTTNTDGTGFGLSIVEEIVEAHGWTISITESEAGGIRFEVHMTGQR